MQKAERLQVRWGNLAFFLTASLLLTADQLSKIWIRSNLAIGQTLFELGIFQIIRIPPNTGAAFGLFKGQSFIIIISFICAVGILLYILFIYHRFPLPNDRLGKTTLGLIFGGAVGNLIERLNPSLGGVTDFINIGIWPAFNIADSAVVIGSIILAYIILRMAATEKHQNGQSA